MKGMVKEVEVVGPERPGRSPKADITMTLTDKRLRSLLVGNAAQQSHMVVS